MVSVVQTREEFVLVEALRIKVFVDEQGFEEEFDEIDDKALHFLLYKNGSAIGVARAFSKENEDVYIIGRVAVLEEFRGDGAGRELMMGVEEELKKRGVKKVMLSSQCRVEGFYKNIGYKSVPPIYKDQGVDHIKMVKDL